MLSTRAPLSTAQRIARASAWTEIVPPGATTFATSELGGRGEAGDARRVVELGRDDARDDRPVAARVLGRAVDEALAAAMRPSRSGWPRSMPGVDDRDTHRCERRRGLPRVVGAIRGDVPLPRSERVGRDEARRRRTRSRSTHATPGIARSSRGCPTAESARSGARLAGRFPVTRSTAAATDAGSAPGRRPTVYRRRGSRREGECGGDGERPDEGARSHAATRTVSGGPPRPSAESR